MTRTFDLSGSMAATVPGKTLNGPLLIRTRWPTLNETLTLGPRRTCDPELLDFFRSQRVGRCPCRRIGDARRVTDDVPRVLVPLHFDEDIAGENRFSTVLRLPS